MITRKTINKQKSGPKTNRMLQAFALLPYKMTPLKQFAADNNVSTYILKQGKRFDKTGLDGRVILKTINGCTYIWRQAMSQSLAEKSNKTYGEINE